jgi:hypothetical protein
MLDLRELLRRACTPSNRLTLDMFCEAVDGRVISIRPVADYSESGMRFAGRNLEWCLLPTQADEFAEKIDVLASAENGHQYLDAHDVGIAVEVSIGEYPDNWRPERE